MYSSVVRSITLEQAGKDSIRDDLFTLNMDNLLVQDLIVDVYRMYMVLFLATAMELSSMLTGFLAMPKYAALRGDVLEGDL